MIIIGFTGKTSKFLPRIFCRRFRHCAPIVVYDNGKMVMYQFIRRGNIQTIILQWRDIYILSTYGWKFVYLPIALSRDFNLRAAWSCVQLSKKAIGMQNWHIQTPNGLYKKSGDCRIF